MNCACLARRGATKGRLRFLRSGFCKKIENYTSGRMTKRRLCAIMVIVGGRKFASRTPTIIERERIRKIRRIFRVGGRRFASRTPTIIEKVFLRCLLLSCCRIMAKNGVWYCLNCSIMLCCACIRRSWKRRAIDVPNWDKRGRAFSPPVLAWRVDFFFG